MTAEPAHYPRMVPGERLGGDFPAHIEALMEAGPAFLTEAFQRAGSLPSDNRVAEIVDAEEFYGGGAGRKLVLHLRYAQPSEHLHTELFVKFPRDFGDPLRDLFSPLMDPEIRFALFSMRPEFPVRVPKCYFGDYDPATQTGILITERIRFGENGVLPFADKCLDYELTEPLHHYQALVRVVAKLAGSHKSGLFGDEIDRRFPFNRETDRIPYTPEQLQEKLAYLADFAERHPGLFPEHIARRDFLEQLAREAQGFLEHEVAIKEFLNAQHGLVALSHWNANIDNAWFWAGTSGGLEAGLLDWGGAGQMSVAQSMFGILCGAETDFWNQHKDALIRYFVSEYARNGGPEIDDGEFNLQCMLFVAMLGLAWMIDAPAIIEAEVSDLDDVRDRLDPRIKDNFLARAQLQLCTVFLNAWQADDFGGLLSRFQARSRR